MFKKFIKNAI